MTRILVVEDNEMSRDILCRRLLKSGFEVFSAENGKEALEVVEKNPPDLIVLDMSLPIMDGWEAARNLKSLEKTAHIPIIALTAHAMVEDLRSTLEAGCDDYDTKPLDYNRLLLKIHHLLGELHGQDLDRG
jgi:two-component system, cell cycle response regulator DivK